MLTKTEIINKTAAYVKQQLQTNCAGHDWWHVLRVTNTALHIAKQEKVDPFIIELASLLHDVDDWKLNQNTPSNKVQRWLKTLYVPDEMVDKICTTIEAVSFKGANVESSIVSLETKVIQDADRLDAMGAIGIARTFAYGGSIGRDIYNPDIAPQLHTSFSEYKQAVSTTINHFHEKLLLLKNRLHTKTAQKLAVEKHRRMEQFLKEFMQEWDGS